MSIAVSSSSYQCNSSQCDRIVVEVVREEVVMRAVRARKFQWQRKATR